jgi:predicted Rossmann fold flavoprotein
MAVMGSNPDDIILNNGEPDIVVIGAGAAGLFAGIEAARRGRSVLVLDHSDKPAEKIRISGGGRCNFTNLETHPNRFISQNPHFAKSALARFGPWDFIDRMVAHHLTWNEKTLGQLFCDQKSPAIIKMLLDDLGAAGGTLVLGTGISEITKPDDRFRIETEKGTLRTHSLIIATGGLSIPKIGATGFGYDIARQFGHEIVETRAGLVPFIFSGELHDRFASISGVATDVTVQTADKTRFEEALLFTHRGLSGPAILQASSYWHPGETIRVDYLPGMHFREAIAVARQAFPKKTLSDWLSPYLPNRFTKDVLTELQLDKKLGDISNKDIDSLNYRFRRHDIAPTSTEGYRTAEVTVGGVDTDGLSSQTMESKTCPGLYFIGEVVDVTGWLGGYNFQWAWASAAAAGAVA